MIYRRSLRQFELAGQSFDGGLPRFWLGWMWAAHFVVTGNTPKNLIDQSGVDLTTLSRNPMRIIEYKNVLKPSVDYLQNVGTLFIDTSQMAAFLGIEPKVLSQLVYTDRVPLPVRLGLGKSYRWSILELAEWVEAGCPRRRKWIELRGHSGWFPFNAR